MLTSGILTQQSLQRGTSIKSQCYRFTAFTFIVICFYFQTTTITQLTMKLLSQIISPLPGLIISLCFWLGSTAGDCGGTRQLAYTLTVGKSNNAKFRTIQSAIDSISINNARWVKIHIYPGKYTYVKL